jgi:hypothetical protein
MTEKIILSPPDITSVQRFEYTGSLPDCTGIAGWVDDPSCLDATMTGAPT